MQRYFGIIKNNELKINLEDIHHLKNVMRMETGDIIEVINDQKCHICKIKELENNHIKLDIVNTLNEESELPIKVFLAQALVNETKMDYILQKGTELGMAELIPLQLERCVVKITQDKQQKKLARWSSICKEASEQSKRIIVPNISNIHEIKELIKLDFDLKILCSVNEKVKTIKSILQNMQEYDKILIVIGPEGGISNQEEEILIENGFIRVSLGMRVLRTETVASYVLSVINYEFMR